MNEFGTCCVCEVELHECVFISLDYKVEVESEVGWGCVQCGLAQGGAVAVICLDCLDKYEDDLEDKLKYLMNSKKGRIPVPPVENRVTHEHDFSLHPEHEGAD